MIIDNVLFNKPVEINGKLYFAYEEFKDIQYALDDVYNLTVGDIMQHAGKTYVIDRYQHSSPGGTRIFVHEQMHEDQTFEISFTNGVGKKTSFTKAIENMTDDEIVKVILDTAKEYMSNKKYDWRKLR